MFWCAFLSGCGQESAVEETPEHANHHSTPKEAKEPEGALAIGEQSEPDTLKGSLKAEAHGKIGPAHLTVAYHSPAVRGRVIWGGLVANNQIWVTGAHSATSLQTDHPITIGGELLLFASMNGWHADSHDKIPIVRGLHILD